MFSLKVAFEELVLRSRKALPLIGLDKAFPDACRVAGGEVSKHTCQDMQTRVISMISKHTCWDIQARVFRNQFYLQKNAALQWYLNKCLLTLTG